MPIYRTNSDRGLWKKYREPQPQHFHKPNYLELDKSKPQVTYSQLQLGENYRSYNNRQSHPNLRAAVAESVNGESEGDPGSTDRWATRRRRGRSFSTTKSCPATPRATTPTRYKYKMNGDDFKYEDVIRAPAHTSYVPQNTGYAPQSSAHYNNRQMMGDSQYTTPTGYPDSESGYSLESRSLAAYSGASSTIGRDPNPGYRYPYTAEPVRQGFGRLGYVPEPQEADRPNPFAGPLSPDADSVVQMFLMNQQTNRGQQQQQRPLFVTGLSATSPGSPGRIEDLPSPTGPISGGYNGQQSSATKKDEDENDKGKDSYYTRTVISQLRKDFLSDSPPKPPQPTEQSPPEKKTNKYLKTENRWTGPPPATNGINGTTNGSLIEDTVHSFQAPQIHHAEVVTLRQDTSSESDEDGSNEPPAHMVLQSPMIPMPKSITSPQKQKSNSLSLYEQQQQFLYEQHQLEQKFKEEQELLKREQQEQMKQQELLYLQQQQQFQQQYFSPQSQLQQQFAPQPQYKPQFQQSYPAQQSTPKQIPQQLHQKQKGTPSLERSFEDPAYANFQSLGEDSASSPSTPPTAEIGSPGKKKGFFSGFFKKPSPSTSGSKKGKGGKGKRPRSEYVPEDEDQYEYDQGSEIPKSKTDGDLHLRTMARSPVRLSPVVPQPVSKGLHQSALSGMHKNESMVTHPGMSFEQELGYDEDIGESFSDEPLPAQPLQRKLSMSKPTDLDELMRLQEQEEEEQRMQRLQDENLRQIQLQIEEERRIKQQMEEQKRIKLQQQQQQEEERRRQHIASKAPPLPARSQTVEEIFKNDPWFQNPSGNSITNGPIYANTLPPLKLDMSLDTTTEEIDIDAILGYPDIPEEQENEMEPPVIRQIEEIIWPKSEPEPVEEPEEESDAGAMNLSDKSNKKKNTFFSFGGDKNKKKKGKQQRPDSPMEEGEEVILAADHYIEEITPKHKQEKKLWGAKKSKKQATYEEELEDMAAPEREDVIVKQKPAAEKKKLWGGKKSKQQQEPIYQYEEEEAAPESYIEEIKPPKPEVEKKSIWGVKKAKPQPVQQPDNDLDSPGDDFVEEVKPKQGGIKKLWGSKKYKNKPTPYQTEEVEVDEPEPVEDADDLNQDTEADLQHELQQEEENVDQQLQQQLHQELQQQIKQKQDLQQMLQEEEQQQMQQKEVEESEEQQPEEENQIIDVVAEAVHHEYHGDHYDEGEIVDERQPIEKKPAKRGLGGFFQKPTWKAPAASKKSKKPGQVGSAQPVDVSHLLDDDFGIEEGVPKSMEPEKPQTDTDFTDENTEHEADQETSDEALQKPTQKPKFKLNLNFKKEKVQKEVKPDARPKPAKFFKSPSWKSPNSNKRTPPRTSPGSKSNKNQDEEEEEDVNAGNLSTDKIELRRHQSPSRSEHRHQSPSRSEHRQQSPSRSEHRQQSPSRSEHRQQSPTRSEQRHQSPGSSENRHQSPARSEKRHQSPSSSEHRYQSPSRIEPELIQQIGDLDLNVAEDDRATDNDSYVEPAPVQTSDDDRRESTIPDEQQYTTEETEGEEGEQADPAVSLPVEMEEPEPTVPIRGRPKTARKKSGGSGLAGLFSSSRPSSKTRNSKRDEPREAPESDEQAEPERHEELERPFANRRQSGFGGLFASKRKQPNKQRPRPISGPPAGIRHDEDEYANQPQMEQAYEEPEPQSLPLRKQRSTGFSGLFASKRGPSTKSMGNLADRRKESGSREREEEEEKPSYNNSTSSLSRAKREKGFGAMFGAPKTRQSGRKPMPRSTTFPLQNQQQVDDQPQSMQQSPKQQHKQQSPQQALLQQSPRQAPRVQESPRISEDRRPPLPLPAEPVNQYSPTPKSVDSAVYDQIEIVNDEQTPPRHEAVRSGPPADPNRQLGRRSGRFRRPQDDSSTINNTLNNSRQISNTSVSPQVADTTPQSVMRDIFAETVVKKPSANAASSRISHEDSMAASGLGADFEYEKAMRNPNQRVIQETRSRSMNKKPSNSSVSRTESYRQAHNSGPGSNAPPVPNDRDKKMTNFNSLPRLGGAKNRRGQPPTKQQQQVDDPNYDSRSLGDRPRSRNAKVEDPCSVM